MRRTQQNKQPGRVMERLDENPQATPLNDLVEFVNIYSSKNPAIYASKKFNLVGADELLIETLTKALPFIHEHSEIGQSMEEHLCALKGGLQNVVNGDFRSAQIFIMMCTQIANEIQNAPFDTSVYFELGDEHGDVNPDGSYKMYDRWENKFWSDDRFMDESSGEKVYTVTESQLVRMIAEAIELSGNSKVFENKYGSIGKFLAGVTMAAGLGLGAQSCTPYNEPEIRTEQTSQEAKKETTGISPTDTWLIYGCRTLLNTESELYKESMEFYESFEWDEHPDINAGRIFQKPEVKNGIYNVRVLEKWPNSAAYVDAEGKVVPTPLPYVIRYFKCTAEYYHSHQVGDEFSQKDNGILFN